MKKFITNPAPAATLQQTTVAINAVIDTLAPYLAPLTDEEKVGTRTMAEGREGLVRLVSRIAVQHENDLARQDNPQDLVAALALDENLEGVRQAVLELMESVADMQLSNSVDIMKLSDDYTKSLQSRRGNNSALDLAMGEVDDWNRRYVNTSITNKPSA